MNQVNERWIAARHDSGDSSSSPLRWFDRNECIGLFFSVPSRDQPFYRELTGSLRDPFVSWSQRHMRIGEPVREKLKQVIGEADFVVPVLSCAALSSPWCRFELDQALAREQAEGRVYLLPLVLEDAALADAPGEIRERRFLSCESWSRQGVRQLGWQLMEEIWHLLLGDSVDSAPRRQAERILQPLDVSSKIRLLAMAMWRRCAEPAKWAEVFSLMQVRLRLRNGRTLHLRLGWTNKDFARLRYDYGLGDELFLVRNEVLEAVSSHQPDDFEPRLLGGAEILDVTPLR